jgi:hypothetical protein
MQAIIAIELFASNHCETIRDATYYFFEKWLTSTMCCKKIVEILFSNHPICHALFYIFVIRHSTFDRISQKAPTAASRGALTFAALIVLRRSIALGSTALSISSSSASSSSSSSTSSLLTEAVVPECVALLLSFLTSVSHSGSSGSGHGSAEHAEKCVEALMRAALLGEAPSGGRNGAGTGTSSGQRWAVNSITPNNNKTATIICKSTTAQKKLSSGR